jgi:hypothetical protein
MAIGISRGRRGRAQCSFAYCGVPARLAFPLRRWKRHEDVLATKEGKDKRRNGREPTTFAVTIEDV